LAVLDWTVLQTWPSAEYDVVIAADVVRAAQGLGFESG